MNGLSRWIKHSSPLVKILMAISVTSAIYVGKKYWYVPYASRRRHKQAEEWADTLLELEENAKRTI